MLPNFLYIGPDKAGSTWLFDVLRQHPQCFVPDAKDVYYFDRYYHLGRAWYEGFFAAAGPERVAVGELSHDYLYSPLAASRIAADLPGVRLIVHLREPVERSFSHYLYMVRSGLTRRPLLEAIEEWPEIVDKSLYGKHLAAYMKLFPRDHIGLFRFEELRKDPERFASGILEFLGLPVVAGFDYTNVSLPAGRARSATLARIAKSGATAARALGLATLVGRIKRGAASRLLYTPYEVSERPLMTGDERRRMAELVAPDRERLRELLGPDAPPWLVDGPVEAT